MRGTNDSTGPVLKGGGPAYLQILDVLTREISQQVWKVGEALPNEKKLSERFGVSIGTVRRAVESLEKAGFVSKMQGLGTFVKDTGNLPVYHSNLPFKLHAQWLAEEPSPKVRSNLIRLEKMSAGHEEANALGLQIGDPIWSIEVRHQLGQQLIALEQLCVSTRVFPTLSMDMLTQSDGNLYRLAAEVFQTRVGQMVDEVSVRSMDSRIANLFNKHIDTPSLRVFRITRSLDNTPIEKREVWVDPSYAHYKATPGSH
ncbi:GntR family transcriptional regulator [Limnobacter sp.]|uniref:GntR family transcriptional regulator n=1 Tax=Limnobacter sp. TaxID=2003368 RepID=UPI00351285BE